MLNKICRLIDYLYYVAMPPRSYAKRIGVVIGENAYISTKNFPSEAYLIQIGNNVRVAKGVKFFTHGGVWSLRYIFNDLDLDYFGKIVIGNNVYIGEGSYIMPGVTIEDNCIIAAGSIVTKSVEKNSIVGGNPIKYLGDVNDLYERLKKINLPTKEMNALDKRTFLLQQRSTMFKVQKFIKKV